MECQLTIFRRSLLQLMSGKGNCIRIAVLFILLLSSPAIAHHPHDIIEAFAVSPDFVNDRTIFISSPGSLNLFIVSRDAGLTWNSSRSGMRGPRARDIALTTDWKSSGIAYVALGKSGLGKTSSYGKRWQHVECDGPSFNLVIPLDGSELKREVIAATYQRLFRVNTNTGKRRKLLYINSIQSSILAIAVSPRTSNGRSMAVSTTDSLLMISYDNGRTWTERTMESAVHDISFSPSFDDDGTIWLATHGSGVLVSTDRGESFRSLSVGLDDPDVNSVVAALSYPEPAHLVAATRDSGLYISEDGGDSWELTTLEVTKTWQTNNHYTRARFSPGYPADSTIFCGTFEGFFITENGGRSWRECNITPTRMGRRSTFSPGFESDSTVFASGYGEQMLRTTDGARTWEFLNTDFYGYGCYRVAVSPTFPEDGIVIAGMGRGVRRTTDAGKTWEIIPFDHRVKSEIEIAATPTYAIEFSPSFAMDRTVYAACNRGEFFRSIDAGKTWTYLGRPAERIRRIVAASGSNNWGILYAAGSGIYHSSDKGSTFSGPLTDYTLYKTALAIAPDFNSSKELLGIFGGEGLLKSSDGGETWKPCGSSLEGYSPYAIVYSPDYGSDGLVFVTTTGGGIFRSNNGGETWSGIGRARGSLSTVFSLSLSPTFTRDGTMLAGTYEGYWLSTDSGSTWKLTTKSEVYDEARDPWEFIGEGWQRFRIEGSINYWVERSRTVSDATRITFAGDGFRLYGATGPEFGEAEILLDGSRIDLVDCYASELHSKKILIERTGLPRSPHTLEVRVTGGRNPAAEDAFVGIDGVEILLGR